MPAKEPAPSTVKRLTELRAAGQSLRKTAETLHEEGFPPPRGWKKWHHSAVRWCLDQEAGPPTAKPTASAWPSPPAAGPATLTVKVHGPYTRTDSLLWDFLLHTVWSTLDKEADHTLPLERGLDALRAVKGRPDREHLWEALDRLAASRVKLEGTLDRHQLTITTSLLAAVLTEDTVSFHFPPPLVKLVKNPQHYTRLHALLIGNR